MTDPLRVERRKLRNKLYQLRQARYPRWDWLEREKAMRTRIAEIDAQLAPLPPRAPGRFARPLGELPFDLSELRTMRRACVEGVRRRSMYSEAYQANLDLIDAHIAALEALPEPLPDYSEELDLDKLRQHTRRTVMMHLERCELGSERHTHLLRQRALIDARIRELEAADYRMRRGLWDGRGRAPRRPGWMVEQAKEERTQAALEAAERAVDLEATVYRPTPKRRGRPRSADPEPERRFRRRVKTFLAWVGARGRGECIDVAGHRWIAETDVPHLRKRRDVLALFKHARANGEVWIGVPHERHEGRLVENGPAEWIADELRKACNSRKEGNDE